VSRAQERHQTALYRCEYTNNANYTNGFWHSHFELKIAMKIEDFEKNIEIEFKNKALLYESLAHRSYLNENPNWQYSHNERLEYLGDAVLELIVSEFLFSRYQNYPEGQLTAVRAALVNFQFLAKIAKNIHLDDFIFLSRGETQDTGKAKEVILANTFEAVLGAIYLDRGYQTASEFVKKRILVNTEEIIEKGLYKDPKSLLQEIIQDRLRVTPTYGVLSESGLDHQKVFKIGVYFNGDLIAEAEGLSKQEGEVKAAEKALEKISEK